MKYLSFLIIAVAICSIALAQNNANVAAHKNIYDFKVQSLNGSTIDFSQFKGKKILIVNTASHCGFTEQYDGLEKLYQDNKSNLVIIGFPSDNFGGQEFQKDAEIKNFCAKKGVTFPLTTRVDVKGDNITPVYKYLTNKSENGVMDASISWNFNKFLIDEKGNLVAHFDSKVTPESGEIAKYLK